MSTIQSRKIRVRKNKIFGIVDDLVPVVKYASPWFI